MSFGFGFGDFDTAINITMKTISAVRPAGPEFASLHLELTSLCTALRAVQGETENPILIITASATRRQQVREILENCAVYRNGAPELESESESDAEDEEGLDLEPNLTPSSTSTREKFQQRLA